MSSNRHSREQSGSQVWSKPRASPPREGARIGGSAYRRVGEARIKIMARIVRVKSWWPIGNLPVHRIREREVDSPLCEDADTPTRRSADTLPPGRRVGVSAWGRARLKDAKDGSGALFAFADSPSRQPADTFPLHADPPIRFLCSPTRRYADPPTRFSCRQKFNSFSGT